MRLTAVVICKNEEDILANALESVRDFDEIVVVDTGSSDRTKAVAARYTDKIYDFPWVDDFSAARNEAIRHATGDWIYSIDADQKLLTPVSQVKAEAERAEAEGHKTALVNTVTDAGQSHWREVLFKRDPEVFWKGAYHECLSIPATFKANVERHRGSSKSKLADPMRGIRILSAQPESPRRSFYLGREHYERRMYDQAIAHMQDYLKVGKWTPEVGEAWLVIARCHWFMNRGDEGRDACLQAIRANPDFKEALLLISQMHFEPWKSKWKNLADAAQNRDVLFIRT
jgi:glycosyltransferase involved in cell wall biosynthesis